MNGRINRKPYLFIMIGLAVFYGVLAGIASQLEGGGQTALLAGGGLVYGIGHLALVVRRLHDIDRSGWNALLLAVPLYNIYLSLMLVFRQGTAGPNAYGPDPLIAAA